MLGDFDSDDSSVSREVPAETGKALDTSAVMGLMGCQLKPQDLLRHFVTFQDHSGQADLVAPAFSVSLWSPLRL